MTLEFIQATVPLAYCGIIKQAALLKNVLPVKSAAGIAFLWGWGSLCSTQDTIISPITHTDSHTFILLYLLFKASYK